MNQQLESTNSIIEMVEDQARELSRQLYLLISSNNQTEISYSQYKTMSVIEKNEPIAVGKLEQLIGSAQSTTSEMVARMTRVGLVAKVRGPLDGRVVRVELTDSGHKLLTKRRQKILKKYRAVLEKLSSAQREHFINALTYLNEHLHHIIL